MPEEIEVPTEHLHENIHEAAHEAGHGEGHKNGVSWVMQVALSSALLAVLAAIAALLAGHHANEAMIEQLQASDQWSYYQAKGIKSAILSNKLELLTVLGKQASKEDIEKISDYKKEQKEIQEKAEEKQKSGEQHLAQHSVLARGVTFFQIAIAMSAIAVLVKKKPLWYVSLGLGVCGSFFLFQNLFS